MLVIEIGAVFTIMTQKDNYECVTDVIKHFLFWYRIAI